MLRKQTQLRWTHSRGLKEEGRTQVACRAWAPRMSRYLSKVTKSHTTLCVTLFGSQTLLSCSQDRIWQRERDSATPVWG